MRINSRALVPAAAAALALGSGGCGRAPSIRVVPSVVDFGRVPRGARLRTVVRLINVGGPPVGIDFVQPECGCTATRLAGNSVASGRPVPLHIRLDTSRLLGDVTRGITVRFADARPDADILLHAQVYPVINVWPLVLDFGRVPLGGARSMELRLDRAGGGRLPQPVPEPAQDVGFQVGRASRSRALLRLTVRPTGIAGSRFPQIRIRTGLADLPVLTVPCQLEVVGHYRVLPAELNFGAVRGPAVQRVEIRPKSASFPGRLAVAWVPRGIAARVRRQGGGYVVSARIGRLQGPRLLQDDVVLSTGNPSEPFVKVPILVAVPGR